MFLETIEAFEQNFDKCWFVRQASESRAGIHVDIGLRPSQKGIRIEGVQGVGGRSNGTREFSHCQIL
jgi:hypothetical protein